MIVFANRLERFWAMPHPFLPAAVVETAAGPDDDAVIALAILAVSIERLARTVESVPQDAWDRVGVLGDREIARLELAGWAVHEGVHHLHDSNCEGSLRRLQKSRDKAASNWQAGSPTKDPPLS